MALYCIFHDFIGPLTNVFCGIIWKWHQSTFSSSIWIVGKLDNAVKMLIFALLNHPCVFTCPWQSVCAYRGYQQQDAHEFMRYLLDRLHTELQGSTWPTTPKKQTNGHATIVSLIFGGLLLSEVTCRPCGSLYKKIDPFLGRQGCLKTWLMFIWHGILRKQMNVVVFC